MIQFHSVKYGKREGWAQSAERTYFILAGHDEFGKLPWSGNIAAFTNVNKVGVLANPEGFQTLKGQFNQHKGNNNTGWKTSNAVLPKPTWSPSRCYSCVKHTIWHTAFWTTFSCTNILIQISATTAWFYPSLCHIGGVGGGTHSPCICGMRGHGCITC